MEGDDERELEKNLAGSFAEFAKENELTPKQVFHVYLEAKLLRIGGEIARLRYSVQHDNVGQSANVPQSYREQNALELLRVEYPIVLARHLELTEETGSKFTVDSFTKHHKDKHGTNLIPHMIEQASIAVYSEIV